VTKRLLIMLIMVGLLLGAIFGFINFKGKMMKQYMASMATAPQTVSTMTASLQEWQPEQTTIASLTAVQGADLSAEVAGIVAEIFFQQGDKVAAGTPLVQLRDYDELAKLQVLKAQAELARITYQRNQAQFAVKAVSQQTLDDNKAQLAQATASVAQQQALVNKKLIRAPFAGRLGIRKVDVGQYLDAGAAIVTLQALDSLYVDFSLPQQMLAKIALGQSVKIKVDAYPNQEFSAKVIVINPKVDTNTRNLQVRAVLKNPDQQLLAGMYATVNIATDTPQRWITLPNSAVSFNSYGSTVFIIEKNNDQLIAKQVFVTTGATRGDQVSVLKGINEGDTVVTSGQIKLRNGSIVLINNTVQPNNNAIVQTTQQ
jgi:membrane fusion protein, multidrug efflux system